MSLFDWFEDRRRQQEALLGTNPNPNLMNSGKDSLEATAKGLWTQCDGCGVLIYIRDLQENQRVCSDCDYHLQISAPERIKNLLDADTWQEMDNHLLACDPLTFHDKKDYSERLIETRTRTKLTDSVLTGVGRINQWPVALGVMDFRFMGGSMGSVVGERLTRLIEYATASLLPVIIICASGGARMQEGIFSLMQMAKISSALRLHRTPTETRKSALLYVPVLTYPTTGGVTASFAMLGDVIVAEPKALIGFAGRRVIEQTLGETLPDDFQTAEYLLKHGFVDMIVHRLQLKQTLSDLIEFHHPISLKEHIFTV